MTGMFIELSLSLRKMIKESDLETQNEVYSLLIQERIEKQERIRKKFNLLYGVDCFPNNRNFYLIDSELFKQKFSQKLSLNFKEKKFFDYLHITNGGYGSFIAEIKNLKISESEKNAFEEKINSSLSLFENELYYLLVEETMILDKLFDDRIWNKYFLKQNVYFDLKTGNKVKKRK